MDISLDQSFSDKDREWLGRSAVDVVQIVQQRISTTPPLGDRSIVCRYEDAVPLMEWRPWDLSVYSIRVGANKLRYSQFVYHLAHELGHLFMHHCRTNGLIEVCATALSLQVLSDISQIWSSSSENYRSDYANKFESYRADAIQEELAQLPIADTVPMKACVEEGNWSEVAAYVRRQ